MDMLSSQEINAIASIARQATQQEIARANIPRPVLRDTGQSPVTDATPVQRTSSTAAWTIDYQASRLVTPDADTPAWTAHVTGSPTAQIV